MSTDDALACASAVAAAKVVGYPSPPNRLAALRAAAETTVTPAELESLLEAMRRSEPLAVTTPTLAFELSAVSRAVPEVVIDPAVPDVDPEELRLSTPKVVTEASEPGMDPAADMTDSTEETAIPVESNVEEELSAPTPVVAPVAALGIELAAVRLVKATSVTEADSVRFPAAVSEVAGKTMTPTAADNDPEVLSAEVPVVMAMGADTSLLAADIEPSPVVVLVGDALLFELAALRTEELKTVLTLVEVSALEAEKVNVAGTATLVAAVSAAVEVSAVDPATITTALAETLPIEVSPLNPALTTCAESAKLLAADIVEAEIIVTVGEAEMLDVEVRPSAAGVTTIAASLRAPVAVSDVEPVVVEAELAEERFPIVVRETALGIIAVGDEVLAFG